jgi:hypothetical protein
MEGRRMTDLMGTLLCASFILSSGISKTVGKWLMTYCNISERWMPFMAGSLFVLPLLTGTLLLAQTPSPTSDDVLWKTIRIPMDKGKRRRFLKIFGIALIPITITYALLTILRDFTEDFANEIWVETRRGASAGIFSNTSALAALLVLILIGGLFIIKNNYRALQINNLIVIIGFSIISGATVLFHFHIVSDFTWIASVSTGIYLGYVPFNSFYFERMLAAYKLPGNVGFFLYIADAFAYMGTVLVLLVKEFAAIKITWVRLFSWMFHIASGAGFLIIIWAAFLFSRIYKDK